ncbi:MAG: tetratricopeptide repeat protein [Chitinophagaceae bacterium]
MLERDKDMAELMITLSDSLRENGNLQGALSLLYDAKKICRKIDRTAETLCLSRMGILYESMGRLEKALIFFEADYNLSCKYLPQFTGRPHQEILHCVALACQNIAKAHISLFKPNKALKYLAKFILLCEALVDVSPGNDEYERALACSYQCLGYYSETKNDIAGTIRHYEIFNQLAGKLYSTDINNPYCLNLLATANILSGAAYFANNQLQPALACYITCYDALTVLGTTLPENIAIRSQMANVSLELAGLYRAFEDIENSIYYYQVSASRYTSLVEACPGVVSFKDSLAVCMQETGRLYEHTGDFNEAYLHYKEFHRLSAKLADENPGNIKFSISLGASYQYLGNMYLKRGDTDNAIEHHINKLHIFYELYRSIPQNETIAVGLGSAYQDLGIAYNLSGNTQKAEICFQKMIEVFKNTYESNPANEECRENLLIACEIFSQFYEEHKLY